MTLVVFLWSLGVFWAAVYAIRASRKQQQSSGLLPSARLPAPENSRQLRGQLRTWRINIQNFHLKAQTRALNTHHDDLIDFFTRPSCAFLRDALRAFYDAGSISGVVGMLMGAIILTLTCYRVLVSSAEGTPGETYVLHKRSDRDRSVEVTTSGFELNPIIPGVTVPWSHLPVLLLALFVSQCIHEAGHAVAAAVDALPLHSVGATLTLVLPSAFVSLSPSLNTLQTLARLRIIAAGAWHNLLLWVLIALSSFVGAGRMWGMIGWKDISDVGVLVIGIETDSPLVYHLSPGTVVTKLDDFPLAKNRETQEEPWLSYLLSGLGSDTPGDQGWCIANSDFYEHPTDCCLSTHRSTHPPAAQLSCFVPSYRIEDQQCIDPIPILAPSTVSDKPFNRCFSASDCQPSQSSTDASANRAFECVRPGPNEHILRIAFKPPIWETSGVDDNEKIILWSGPRREVWEQVTVGTTSPRSRYLPLWLPTTLSLFFQYISTLSLSLYIFNLFPLPFLDGSHFLSAFLDYIGGSPEPVDVTLNSIAAGRDLEADLDGDVRNNAGSGRSSGSLHSRFEFLYAYRWRFRQRRTQIERVVRYSTIGLMCVTCVALIYSGH